MVTTHDDPVAAVMSVSAWRRRAIDGGLDPDAVLTRGVREARTKQHAMIGDAQSEKATLLVFRGVEEIAVVAPITVLSDAEVREALSAPLGEELADE